MPRHLPFGLTLLSSLLLAACGGGGGGNADSGTTSLSGVAADGYLIGAFVCLDRNDNLRCDSAEPRTTTDSQGAYTLTGLSSADTANHRVIVEVHTGVIDSDTPGVTVDMPYVLTAPVGKHAFISPFSTLLAGTMRQHPELTADHALDLLANLLHTPAASLLGNYMNGELADTGKQRLHRIGRGLAREMAYFTKYVRLMPGYTADNDADILPALATHLNSLDSLGEILDVDFSAASVNEKYLDAATSDNAMEAAQFLVKLNRQPLASAMSGRDFFALAKPRYTINDVFPADCHAYIWGNFFPTPCPADYPANSVQIRSETSGISLDTVSLNVTGELWSLSNGLTIGATQPRYNSLHLENGDWQFPTALIQPFPVSWLDGDSVRTTSLSGLNIRQFLRHTSLINGPQVTEPLLQAIPAGAVFPGGAEASRYLGISIKSNYFLSDIDPFNDSFEGIATIKSRVDGGGYFASLNELLDYFNPAGGNRVLTVRVKTKLVGGQLLVDSVFNCQFTSQGEVLIKRAYLNADGSLNHEQTLTNGAWTKFNEGGKEFLKADFPTGVLSSDLPLIWTVYNNEVLSVSAWAAGTKSENIYFNDTAINAIRTALQN